VWTPRSSRGRRSEWAGRCAFEIVEGDLGPERRRDVIDVDLVRFGSFARDEGSPHGGPDLFHA